MSRPLNIKPGDKFNFLTYLEESDIKFQKDWRKVKYGMFECDCGKTKELIINNVKHGNTISCGCQRTGKKKGIIRRKI
jgi:hypothetical protein